MYKTSKEILEAAGFVKQDEECYTMGVWTIRIINRFVEAFDETKYCILPAIIQNIEQILKEI